MKIAVELLKDALKILKPVTRRHHVLPFTRIKIAYVHPFDIQITATNGDVWMTTLIPETAGDTSLTFVVDPQELENVLNTDARVIAFDADPNKPELIILTGDSWSPRTWSAIIPSYSVEDFPHAPTTKQTSYLFTLYEADWKSLLRSVVPSAARDDSRPVLNGVQLSYEDGNVIATAADGFRLTSQRVIPHEEDFAPILFPLPALKLLPKRVQNISFHEVNDARDDLYLEFTTQRTKTSPRVTTSMVLPLVEGRYPDFRQIIPTEEMIVGTCGLPFWIIEAAAKVKNGTSISFSNGKAELAISDGKPQRWTSVGITLTPNEGHAFPSCSFNPTYLYELALAAAWTGTIQLQATHTTAYLTDNGRTRSVLMAMVLPQNPFTRKEREAAIVAQAEAAAA